jgi:ribosomal protein S27E
VAKAGVYKGRCRCGKVLTFRQSPLGYKAICRSCKAVVRLKPPAVSTASGTIEQWTDSVIVVQCIKCEHKYPSTFRHMGRRLDCPKCGEPNLVPMPGRHSSGEIRKPKELDDAQTLTEEIPLSQTPDAPDDLVPPDLGLTPLDDES